MKGLAFLGQNLVQCQGAVQVPGMNRYVFCLKATLELAVIDLLRDYQFRIAVCQMEEISIEVGPSSGEDYAEYKQDDNQHDDPTALMVRMGGDFLDSLEGFVVFLSSGVLEELRKEEYCRQCGSYHYQRGHQAEIAEE